MVLRHAVLMCSEFGWDSWWNAWLHVWWYTWRDARRTDAGGHSANPKNNICTKSLAGAKHQTLCAGNTTDTIWQTDTNRWTDTIDKIRLQRHEIDQRGLRALLRVSKHIPVLFFFIAATTNQCKVAITWSSHGNAECWTRGASDGRQCFVKTSFSINLVEFEMFVHTLHIHNAHQ